LLGRPLTAVVHTAYAGIKEGHRLGLKRKPLFSFSRKAKISENSLTFREISFRENFRFRESFRENFRFRESFREIFRFRESFREKFLFLGWFSTSVLDLDTHLGGS
jgi:hypothetical protein